MPRRSSRPRPAERRRPSRHHVLERAPRARVEDVEDLVELDGRARVVGADAPAVVDVVAVVRAELEVHVAVGDARERAELDHRLGAAPQRHVVVVADLERHLGEAVGETSISLTDPTFAPPTRTSLPLTSWPAFSNSAVTR